MVLGGSLGPSHQWTSKASKVETIPIARNSLIFRASRRGGRNLGWEANLALVSRQRRGVGLLFSLSLIAILVGLVGVLVVMTRQRVYQLQRTQWAVQARLNAQSGFQQYCVTRTLLPTTIDCSLGTCEMRKNGADLYFVGRCRNITRTLMLPDGNVRRVREVEP